jgi:hypothetical protein
MPVSVNWPAKEILVTQDYLRHVQGSLYELDVNQFRLDLKALEAGEDGIIWEDTHRHYPEVTLAGVTFARVVEITNGYTITFEEKPSPYRVRCVGANHNISDVMNLNTVSLIIGNSAGLIVHSIGSGLSTEEHNELMSIRSTLQPMISEDLGNSELLIQFVKNRKFLQKVGNTWYLVIRNSDDTADLVRKALKDKSGNDITDLAAGIMAEELASSV